MKVFNFLLPFSDFCYILQQEEYDLKRYIKWLPRFFFRRNFQVRDHLRVTKRVKIMLGVIGVIWVVSFGVIGAVLASGWWWLVWLGIKMLLTPIDVYLGTAITEPYFEAIKSKRRKLAAEIMRTKGKNTRIVVVAGSFGKTTTKNFIFQLCRYKYKAVMIPGNINTPAGIADWVINNFREGTELLIGEVDAFYVGEIRRSLEVIPPDVAVLTNIGDQHLERFGGKAGLAQALADTFLFAKAGAVLICDRQTELELPSVSTREMKFINPEKVKAEGLSVSNEINLGFAVTVARNLGVTEKMIKDGIKDLELPERRQYAGEVLGYEGIDDSYNISFTTAQAGLAAARELAKKRKKKLLVVTAGIPELSRENRSKNEEYGKVLAERAEAVVLLRSMLAGDVLKGLGGKGRVVGSFAEMAKKLQDWYPISEYVLLLQPELTDLYY